MRKNSTRVFDPAGPFTTGQVKTMLSVSDRTVQKWCDSGMLPCYRLPGYGKDRPGDRRVTRRELLEFIAKHGIPTPEQLNARAS